MGETWRDVFDCMRLINLPQRRDRLRASRAELGLAGLGVGEGPGQVEVFEAIRPDGPGPFTATGVHGCYMSHLQVLREAADRGVERLLVMEDDVALSPLFRQPPPGLVEAIRQTDWDMLWLGHLLELEPANGSGFDLSRYDGKLVQAHLFAVNGRTLRPLVTFLETILTRPRGHHGGGPMPVDGAYNMFRRQNPEVKTLVVAPSLARQRSSRSDLAERRWFDRWLGVRQMVAQGRSAKEWFARREMLGRGKAG